MSQSATKRVRYNFGTTGGEVAGERTCKRRSAKHLEFLPSLLEGRRSIHLSYGRVEFSPCKSLLFTMGRSSGSGRLSFGLPLPMVPATGISSRKYYIPKHCAGIWVCGSF